MPGPRFRRRIARFGGDAGAAAGEGEGLDRHAGQLVVAEPYAPEGDGLQMAERAQRGEVDGGAGVGFGLRRGGGGGRGSRRPSSPGAAPGRGRRG